MKFLIALLVYKERMADSSGSKVRYNVKLNGTTTEIQPEFDSLIPETSQDMSQDVTSELVGLLRAM